MRVSPAEINILRALARSEAPAIRSTHLVRLEMLGLVIDSVTGLKLTALGRSIAASKIEPTDADALQFDRSGSRKMGAKIFHR